MNRGVVHGNGTTADEVHVTFDGTEYELPRIQFPGGDDYGYGAFGETGPDFSTYPLMLSYSEEADGWFVFTETAGTYTIVAYTENSSGGTTLGELADVSVIEGGDSITIYVSTTPYDITSGETYSDVDDSVYNNTNVLNAPINYVNVPSGCYVVIYTSLPTTEWATDRLTVYDGSREQQITSGFECRVLEDSSSANVFFTMQIPADGLAVNFFGNVD